MDLLDLYAKITLDDSAYTNGVEQASAKGNSFANTLGKTLVAAAKAAAVAIGAVTTAITAFAASSVKTGMEFDKAMSQVAATMGITVSEVENLRQAALDMGSTTAFTATEAAEALNYMALAGYDAETSIAQLPNVLNLAAAGGIDLAYASDMITDSQSALGLTLAQTNLLVDQMAKASSKSNTSVEQLGEAILTVGGTAQYMSGGTEELAMVLGVLADNGIKGSEAGTHLRNMLLSLSSPASDEAAATIERLGLQVFDADGKMRSFAEIFPELSQSMAGLTDQEKIDAFAALFNTRDIAAATALLNTTQERWDELGDAIVDSAGAAEQMAATQLDNLNGDVTLFKSALEGAQIVLSDQLTPSLRELVQAGTQSITNLSDAFKSGGLEGLLDALGSELEAWVGRLVDMVPRVVETAVELIKAFVGAIAKNIPMIASGAIQIVLTLVDGIIELAPELVKAAAALIVGLAEGLTEGLPELIPALVEAVILIVETLLENLPLVLEAGQKLLMALWKGIFAALPTLLAALPEIIGGIIEFFLSMHTTMMQTGVQLLLMLVGALPDIISGIVAALPEIISAILSALIEAYPQFMDAGLQLFLALITNLPEIITSLLEAVPQIVTGIIGALATLFPEMATAGQKMLESLFDQLPAAIVTMVSKVPQIITRIVGAIQSGYSSMVSVGKALMEGVASGIMSMASTLAEKAMGVVNGVISTVKGALGIHSPSRVFAEIGQNMALGLSEGWSDAMDSVNRDIDAELSYSRYTSADDGDRGSRSGGLVVNQYFYKEREQNAYEIGRETRNGLRRAGWEIA